MTVSESQAPGTASRSTCYDGGFAQRPDATPCRAARHVPETRTQRAPAQALSAASGRPGCRSPCPSAGRFAGGWSLPWTTTHGAAWASAFSKQFRRAKRFVRSQGVAIQSAGRAAKYLTCDKGSQFWCPGFKRWCKRRKIKPRFGAVGKHGSIAVVERFILTMKTHCTWVVLVPLRRDKMREELGRFVGWYNESRPHTTLKGATPDEVYHGRHPTCRYPRFEPRTHWPRGSPCAKPGARSAVGRANGWNCMFSSTPAQTSADCHTYASCHASGPVSLPSPHGDGQITRCQFRPARSSPSPPVPAAQLAPAIPRRSGPAVRRAWEPDA